MRKKIIQIKSQSVSIRISMLFSAKISNLCPILNIFASVQFLNRGIPTRNDIETVIAKHPRGRSDAFGSGVKVRQVGGQRENEIPRNSYGSSGNCHANRGENFCIHTVSRGR